MEDRRERDRILRWVMKAFTVLAIVGTLGGFSQFVLSWKLYREVSGLRLEHSLEQAERASRLKSWDSFRDQLNASIIIRDGEIRIIKNRLEQLEAKRRWDDGLYRAKKDRAGQK